VLLIEDDPDLGRQVVDRLTAAGFSVTWWKVGQRPTPADLEDVRLVLLDLMLPGSYGMDVLKGLREFSEVPVLVLSARNDTADKVRALKLGADDYMTKPFWPEELVERVRARLRRPKMDGGEELEIGALRIDLRSREVFVGEDRVELTRVEFGFLVELASRPGASLTRKHLAESVLDPERDGGERTLDVHVSRLRKKLGAAVPIETVWGIGYRLALRRDE
jgi:DNA-binding response OmpR family regulator